MQTMPDSSFLLYMERHNCLHIFYMISYLIYLRDVYCNECVHSNGNGHSEVFHHSYGPLFVEKDLQARGSMGTLRVLILFNVQHQLQTIQDSCTGPHFIQAIVSQSVHYKTYFTQTFYVIRNFSISNWHYFIKLFSL